MGDTPRYADLLARLDVAAGSLGVELGLDRVRRALAWLGDPQRRYLTVQIAGTNGKGSTAAMTEAILRAAGLRTGLYTSPHLARFTERIQVAGCEADGDQLAALDLQVQATGERLTYFEIATVLAFLAFAEAGVQVAVLETGLGGRLDAVTCCEPVATAITSIGLDHTDYLGSTLAEIAREKAGILKPGVQCFLGALPDEAEAVIAGVAGAVGTPLHRLADIITAVPKGLGLAGAHQRANAALALALARSVADRAGQALDPATISGALASVSWPGRLERIDQTRTLEGFPNPPATTPLGKAQLRPRAPDVWLDCAHNAEGARALARAMPKLVLGQRVTIVLSVSRDKDVDGVLAALAPIACRLIATGNDSPRALAPADLAQRAAGKFAEVAAVADPWEALSQARAAGAPVLVCGSIFLVGPLRARLLGQPVDPRRTSDPLTPATR